MCFPLQMFADIRVVHTMMSSGFPQHGDVQMDSASTYAMNRSTTSNRSTTTNRFDDSGLNEDGLEYWLHTTYAKTCDSDSDDRGSSCSYVLDHYGPYTE